MRRSLLSIALVGFALALPTAALATLLPPRSHAATGTLTSTGAYSFTIQTPGRATGVLAALTTAANRITAEDLPYVWGGGHGEAGIASVGERGPGFNGRRRGYDCSGSVAAVLAGAGLWPAGAGVPNDAGVIAYLRRHGEIVRGAGDGVGAVTLYDDPGVHIFMNINGRFFGTSDGGRGANRRGGPGWLDDGAWDAHSPRFRRYHFVPSVLKASTDAGFTLAFQTGASVIPTLPTGIKVRVIYRTTNQGTMVAQSVTAVGELNAAGTVTAIAPDGSSFTIKRDSGPILTLPATGHLAQALLDQQLVVGDSVAVTYLLRPQRLVLALTVTAAPPTTTATTTTPTTTTPTITTPTTTTPTTTAPTTTTPTTTTPTTTTPTTTTTPASSGPDAGGGWGGSGGAGF